MSLYYWRNTLEEDAVSFPFTGHEAITYEFQLRTIGATVYSFDENPGNFTLSIPFGMNSTNVTFSGSWHI